MTIRGFIFDLDGVLTDTAEYHFLAWKRLADELGIPFDRQENEALRGIPRRKSLLLLLKGRSYPEEQLQEFMERKNRYYNGYIDQITSRDLLPGAREFLLEVRAAGLKIAVGSASKNAHQVIARLGIAPLLDAVADGHKRDAPKAGPRPVPVRRPRPEPDAARMCGRRRRRGRDRSRAGGRIPHPGHRPDRARRRSGNRPERPARGPSG